MIAYQYDGPATLKIGDPQPAYDGIEWRFNDHTGYSFPAVTTTHGNVAFVNPGDYVVKEPDGNGYYPCKAEIFEAGHDPKTRPFNPAEH